MMALPASSSSRAYDHQPKRKRAVVRYPTVPRCMFSPLSPTGPAASFVSFTSPLIESVRLVSTTSLIESVRMPSGRGLGLVLR